MRNVMVMESEQIATMQLPERDADRRTCTSGSAVLKSIEMETPFPRGAPRVNIALRGPSGDCRAP
jgi:hypothetical protein